MLVAAVFGWWGIVASSAQEISSSRGTFREPLVDAVDRGDLVAAQSLVRNGADVNVRGWLDVTPLMRAAYRGNGALAQYLIQSGADVDSKDIGGATALHLASREGHADIVRLLLSHGADSNAHDDEGWTPLMRAALAGDEESVQALLEYNASVHPANARGETALMSAIQARSESIAALLLSEGANPDQSNAFGVSVHQMLREKNMTHVEGLLAAGRAPDAYAGADISGYAERGSLSALEPAGRPAPQQVSNQLIERKAAQESQAPQPYKRRIPEANQVLLNQQATVRQPAFNTPAQAAAATPASMLLASRPDLAPFLNERGEVDFTKVKTYGASVLTQIEQQEAAQVQQALDQTRAELAREAAERIEKVRIQAEAEAAVRIQDAKIKMAQFEAGMRRYAGTTQAAVDGQAVASGVLDASLVSFGDEASHAPAAGSANDSFYATNQAEQPGHDVTQLASLPPASYYENLSPAGYPPAAAQASAAKNASKSKESGITFSEQEVKALIDAAVKQALENRATEIIRKAEEKASELEAKAERKMAVAMTAAREAELTKQATVSTPVQEGHVEVARAVIEPAPKQSPNATVDYETATTRQTEEPKGVWLEVGDFVTGRDAITHFAEVARKNALRGLKPRILYPEENRTHVAIQIGPLNSYDAAKRLCGYFRTGSVDCILLNN